MSQNNDDKSMTTLHSNLPKKTYEKDSIPVRIEFIKNLLDVEQENMKQLIIMIKKNTKKDKNKG